MSHCHIIRNVSLDRKQWIFFLRTRSRWRLRYWHFKLTNCKEKSKSLEHAVNMPWCSAYHYWTSSFNKAWTQVLHRFKSCSRRVGDSRWWGSLTMVPAGNKAKCLLSVNHTTKIVFMEGSSSWYVTTLPDLVTIGIVVVEIKCFWFITCPQVTTYSKGCVT